ncbi:MAG: hypothetical protein U9O94_10205 [Nanoarchaeota archaeon]|nr:hypothetical protein [Nanoarchaeota archaeon]
MEHRTDSGNESAKEKKVTSLQDYLDSVTRMLDYINRMNAERLRYRKVLFNDPKEKLDPRYLAIKVVEEGKKLEPNKFLGMVNYRLEEIEEHDNWLAREIRKIVAPHFDKDSAVRRILYVLTKYDEDRIYNHFNEYSDVYMEHIRYEKDRNLARWTAVLMNVFLKLHNEKINRIEELNKNKQRSNEGLEQYGDMKRAIEEAKFIMEAIERIVKEKVDGIANKNPRINIKPIIHLIRYPDEISYIKHWQDKIIRGEDEGKWEEFTEVQTKAPTEIAETLDNFFGDPKSAGKFKKWSLKVEKGGLGDDPPKWIEEINNLKGELEGEWQNVVVEAENSFSGLFDKCNVIIQQKFDEGFSRIKSRAQSLLEEEKEEPNRTRRKVRGITNLREKALDKRIKRERKDYNKIEDKGLKNVRAFWKLVKEFEEKSDMEKFGEDATLTQKDILEKLKILPEVGARLERNSDSPEYSAAMTANAIGQISGVMANENSLFDRIVSMARVTTSSIGQINGSYNLAKDSLSVIIDEAKKVLTELGVNAKFQDNQEVKENG